MHTKHRIKNRNLIETSIKQLREFHHHAPEHGIHRIGCICEMYNTWHVAVINLSQSYPDYNTYSHSIILKGTPTDA